MKKRLLAFLLACSMVMSVMPAAFATEGDDPVLDTGSETAGSETGGSESSGTVTNTEELIAAIKAGETKIYLADGEYVVDLYSIAYRDSLTIVGQGAGTVIHFANQQVRASSSRT